MLYYNQLSVTGPPAGLPGILIPKNFEALLRLVFRGSSKFQAIKDGKNFGTN